MTFDFARLIEHITLTRNARAGTVLGSGTISNYDRSLGSACIAERRMLEQIEQGKPVTSFLKFGDSVRIEMFDADGRSIFGAIDQKVVKGDRFTFSPEFRRRLPERKLNLSPFTLACLAVAARSAAASPTPPRPRICPRIHCWRDST